MNKMFKLFSLLVTISILISACGGSASINDPTPAARPPGTRRGKDVDRCRSTRRSGKRSPC